jgi:hypothetical protein
MARNIFHRTNRVAQISGTKRNYDGEPVFKPITARNECDTMLIPVARGVIGNS